MDAVVAFGGFTGFIDWTQLFENIYRAPIHIFQFNRNDTPDALHLYQQELNFQRLTYCSYSDSFIKYMYNYFNTFKIQEMVETKTSYFVVGRNIA